MDGPSCLADLSEHPEFVEKEVCGERGSYANAPDYDLNGLLVWKWRFGQSHIEQGDNTNSYGQADQLR